MILAGWGNHPRVHCRTALFDGAAEARHRLEEAPLIVRGCGRSYGDASLQPNLTLLTSRLDRLLAFDADTGVLTCEAGASLATILRVFLPRGWLPPVTPGTKFVTVGGMVASDVHGKNHHVAGSFGRHVRRLRLVVADGREVACGPDQEAELFRATIGGMGLTGIVTEVSFQLMRVPSAFIRQQVLRAPNLEAALAAFDESADWTYSMAWIDCLSGGPHLGRCLVSRGELAHPEDLPAPLFTAPLVPLPRPERRVPADLPGWVLNPWSVRSFNALYYHAPRSAESVVDMDRFFFPLDALLEWNRLYGRAGFTQYQCVLPRAAGRDALKHLLSTVQRARQGSFLAVLKLFGPAGDGLLSFPMEGYTLALDFPWRAPVAGLLTELDAIVADHGGRIYLAKDAHAAPDMLRRGYPLLEQFQAVRARWGAQGRLRSLLAERTGL